MFHEFLDKGNVLNQVMKHFSDSELLAVLLNPCVELRDLGRNLNCCIETHIHGDIELRRDVDEFYVDSSYQNTLAGEQAEALCKKYEIALVWIPKRQIDVKSIGDLFHGPKIPELAEIIDTRFGKQGIINAELIGQASRDSAHRTDIWEDIGSELELFQYLKQLWHTVGYFG